jgi:hypothetical protein
LSAIDRLPKASKGFSAALALIGQGLPCFPCRADKKPATRLGFKDATYDRDVLHELWRRHPGSLVGVPAGDIFGIDVLDIDPRHGGESWFGDPSAPINETTSAAVLSRVGVIGAELLVPKYCEPKAYITDTDQSHGNRAASSRLLQHPSLVDGLRRTTAPHGMTSAEVRRLSGAVRFMDLYRKRGQSGFWWATTNKGTTRNLIGDVWKRIGKLQGRSGIRQYSVTVFEASGGTHAHILFLGNEDIARRLKGSSIFGGLIHVAPVTDPTRLAQKYLTKERTPQAAYGRQHACGGRIRGSHRLEGGGDRVRLSRNLERDAVGAGYVDTWAHTNARRSPDKRTETTPENDGPEHEEAGKPEAKMSSAPSKPEGAS